MFSLGLVVPVSAGPFTDRAVAALTASAGPAKTVTLMHDGQTDVLQTRAATVGDLLIECNVVRRPEDALDADPDSPLIDGEVVRYRAAVPVTLVVDDATQTLRTTMPTVGALLAERGVAFDAHDQIDPAPDAQLAADTTVRIAHATAWTETVRQAIAPPVRRVPSVFLAPGATKVIDLGAAGVKELSYLVSRPSDRTAPLDRTLLSSRVLRPARARVVASGIAGYVSLAQLAARGFDSTIKIAGSAISMLATAYTADCRGCTGLTASGRPAGTGVVAVDPRVIPLGTKLYIPGYGRAVAGDTGGAIRGNRIDLGFTSTSDAFRFGARRVLVYVLGK